jgi:hypothetical protein
MAKYGADEFPVSRKPRGPEPGDWFCENPRCSGKGNGPKPFANFQRNNDCKICGEPKPRQPCMYWMYMGSCRRQEDNSDCPYHHREDDKGLRYGEQLPAYILGKGGNRDRSTSAANWNQPYRSDQPCNRQQWDQEAKCACGKALAACGACGKGYAQSAQWQEDWEEGQVWSSWEDSTAPSAPPPEDPAVVKEREKLELRKYLLAS